MPYTPRPASLDFSNVFTRPPRATMTLMLATGIASIAAMWGARDYGALTPIGLLLDFSPAAVVARLQLWTPFTWLFIAKSPINLILYELFGLWMFASALERMWGTRRFLLYFFATGAGAALATTALALLSSALMASPTGAFHGTWAVLDALVLAWVLMNWNATVYVFLFPVRAPWLLLVTLAVPALYVVMGFWEQFIPIFAAMAIGFLLLRKRPIAARRLALKLKADWLQWRLKRRARHLRLVRPQEAKRADGQNGRPPRYLH